MWKKYQKHILISAAVLFVAFLAGMLVHRFFHASPPYEYDTLSEISAYAETLPEFPEADDIDWLDPNYDSFDKERSTSNAQLIFDRLGYKKIESWSVKHLIALSKSVTKTNLEFGLNDGPNNFIHIKALEETNIYLFGDVHSAFHSLVRDLNYLKSIHVIDDNLKILNEFNYLVFNGDAINRNAYNIDTLTLLLTLMKKNPHNVFYVAGVHERNGHWLDYGLRRELVARGKYYSSQSVPAEDQLLALFASLPEAIFISSENGEDGVLRIAFNAASKMAFDQNNLNPSFLKQTERVRAYAFTTKAKGAQPIDVKAAFKTEEWRKSNRIKHGLALLDQDHGATTWASLSSPIYVNKAYLNFYDDAFVQIQIHKSTDAASIARIYSDFQTRDGFKKDDPLSIISARPIDDKAKTKPLKVASTMSLVRGVPTMGQQAQRGLNLMLNQFNSSKNSSISTVRLYIDNDDYVPIVARANVEKYIESGIKFLLLPTGTPTLMSYIDITNEHDFAVFFPITGSSGLRSTKYPNLVHFRATYEDEVRALIATLREEHGATKYAFFYQDDSYGLGPFNTAVSELKKLGITNYIALPYTRGSTSFAPQISELQKAQPDALGFFSTAFATQELIRQMGVNSIANTQLFGISFVGELTLRRFIKRYGLNFLFGAVVPNPKTSNFEIARDYRKAMDEIHNDYDVFSFEAFVGTAIFLHAVTTLGDKPITPKNMLHAMENMKSQNFRGLKLNFDKSHRSLSTAVWLETSEDTQWKEYPIK